MNPFLFSRRFCCFIGLFGSCFLTASSAHSQPVSTAETHAFAPARLFDPTTISLRVLPNGVRGVVQQTRGTGVVAVQVWVRAGSRYETNANAGAAHLVETLALRASRKYPRQNGGQSGGVEESLTGIGAAVGSQTSRDATFYSATVASVFLPAAVRALADASLHPILDDAAIASGKDLVEAELSRRSEDPIATVADLAYRTAFSKHPYRKPALGTPGVVDALSPAAVRAYHKARYAGANISVIIVGDLSPTAAHALIAREFGAAEKGAIAPRIAPEVATTGLKQLSLRRGRAASTVALAWRAPGIANPQDVVAMDVLLAFWKEGSEAALRAVLIGQSDDEAVAPSEAPAPNEAASPEPLALAYDVDFLTQRDPGLFIVSLLSTPDKRVQATQATLAEIARVRANGIDAASLSRAKLALRRQYIAQGETPSGQAGALGFYEMISDYRFGATYLDRVARVSSSDIKRVAARYLSGTAYVQVTIDPEPARRPPTPPSEGVITASMTLKPRALRG